ELAIRLEAQLPLYTGTVRLHVRDANPIARLASVQHRCKRHRGSDPLPPICWHDGRVHARHARPEEHRARGNGVAFPSTEIMRERRIGIETEPGEQVEESER